MQVLDFGEPYDVLDVGVQVDVRPEEMRTIGRALLVIATGSDSRSPKAATSLLAPTSRSIRIWNTPLFTVAVCARSFTRKVT